MADKNRPLHILKYLWDHTDEEHPAIITDILAHLEGCGIRTNRKRLPRILRISRIADLTLSAIRADRTNTSSAADRSNLPS